MIWGVAFFERWHIYSLRIVFYLLNTNPQMQTDGVWHLLHFYSTASSTRFGKDVNTVVLVKAYIF